MSDVLKDNARRQRASEQQRRRLAQSAWHYFTQTDGGKELYEHLAHTSGDDQPAYKASEGFNPHGAAFRDGMRASFLEIKALIKEHQRNGTNTND